MPGVAGGNTCYRAPLQLVPCHRPLDSPVDQVRAVGDSLTSSDGSNALLASRVHKCLKPRINAEC